MIRTLSKHIGRYRTASVLSILSVLGEAGMDILLPFVMAKLIDRGIARGDLGAVYRYGALMLLCAVMALFFGIAGGKFASRASSGFASNLRDAMYSSIQNYSFSNIDKFSTAGLITRLTTDVTNVQNAYQMMIRMMMRSPAMLILALCMTISISPKLSLIFLGAALFLGCALDKGMIRLSGPVSAILAAGGAALILGLAVYNAYHESRTGALLGTYNFPVTVLMSAGIWGLFMAGKDREHPALDKLCAELESCSFGIYLIHMAILKLVFAVFRLDPIGHGGALTVLGIAVGALLVSYLIVKLLRLVPGVRKVI